MIPSVNFHIWEPCNMRCKFCFATFQEMKQTILPKGHLPIDQSIDVVRKLSNAGFEKITFVGGEPTLCPWLIELVIEAKRLGMNTGIVTNGSKLTEDYLTKFQSFLDWIGISVDSLDESTNIKIGRAIMGNKPINSNDYYHLFDRIHKFGFQLKINTVVTSLNYQENLSEFILNSGTTRWKVFQVLPIKGENDTHIDQLQINDEQFESFIQNHHLQKDIMVPESNDLMLGSYAMVDPAGRFFNNSTGSLVFSQRITDVGAQKAYEEVHPDEAKFLKRGGKYNW